MRRIVLREVCDTFALDSFLALPCVLRVIMTDWGHDPDYYLRCRVRH